MTIQEAGLDNSSINNKRIKRTEIANKTASVEITFLIIVLFSSNTWSMVFFFFFLKTGVILLKIRTVSLVRELFMYSRVLMDFISLYEIVEFVNMTVR